MIQPNGASRLKGVVYLASTACYEPVLHLLHQCVTLYNKVLLAESSLYPAIWGLYILDQDYRERMRGQSKVDLLR